MVGPPEALVPSRVLLHDRAAAWWVLALGMGYHGGWDMVEGTGVVDGEDWVWNVG